MSFSPGNGFRAGSGVSKTMGAVSTGSGDAAAGNIASSTSGDESTSDVSSTSNMIPDIGSARETRDGVTSSLAVNVEFRTSTEGGNEARVRIRSRSDVEGVRSSVGLSRATASGSTLTTVGDESARNVSSSGRNVVPGVGGAREAGDGVATDLAVNIELGTGGDGGNDVGVGVGGSSDVKGLGTGVGSGREAQDRAQAEGDGKNEKQS